MSNPPTKSPPRPNPRIILLVLALAALIAAAVITTDIFSVRNRRPATQPATAPH